MVQGLGLLCLGLGYNKEEAEDVVSSCYRQAKARSETVSVLTARGSLQELAVLPWERAVSPLPSLQTIHLHQVRV